MNNNSEWKDRAIAYTMVVVFIVVFAFSALWTILFMVMLFPLWLFDRTVYDPFLDMSLPD